MMEIENIRVEQNTNNYDGDVKPYTERVVVDIDGETKSIPVTRVREPYVIENRYVPDVLDFNRVFVVNGELHADVWLNDGTIAESSVPDSERMIYHFDDPDREMANECPEVWRRPSKEENEINTLVRRGLTPAEALDYWMIEMEAQSTMSEWAKQRGVTQQAVSENVSKAREKISSDIENSNRELLFEVETEYEL